MQLKAAITSLKVEKGCVNMDCKYCTKHNECNLETILKVVQDRKESEERL